MPNPEPPHTIIEAGDAGDLHYLVYREKRLQLKPTEYAIALGLLSDDGLDVIEVGEERLETRSARFIENRFDEFVNIRALQVHLHKLRTKIETFFGDELILPRLIKGSKGAHYNGLRLWTREQLAVLHYKIANPGDGVFSIRDERLRWHLFVNGCDVKYNRSSILACHIVEKASSKMGFRPTSEEFQTVYKELTRRDRKMPALSLSAILSQLRRLLEKQVGMTLTKRQSHPSRDGEDQPIRLVQHIKKMVNE